MHSQQTPLLQECHFYCDIFGGEELQRHLLRLGGSGPNLMRGTRGAATSDGTTKGLTAESAVAAANAQSDAGADDCASAAGLFPRMKEKN